jgi:hypothetical protein
LHSGDQQQEAKPEDSGNFRDHALIQDANS